MNLFNVAKKLYTRLFLDNSQKNFIKHNEAVWQGWIPKETKSEILFENYHLPYSIVVYSYLVNILAKKYSAKINFFGDGNQLIKKRALNKMFKSFNAQQYIDEQLNSEQIKEKEIFIDTVFPTIKNKKEIFDVKIRDIPVGCDIYSTYLRLVFKPTVYLDDTNFRKIFSKGIQKVIFWDDYFKANDVKAVVVSHSCYLKSNVVAKVARKNKIPVYIISGVNGEERCAVSIQAIDCDFVASKRFASYRKIFASLSEHEQAEGIEWAKKQLDNRLSGGIRDESMLMAPLKSSFKFDGKNLKQPALEKNDKIKILICTHCFFDDPYCFGGGLFVDFYEWLMFLGEISEKTDYDWYLRPHPDGLKGTMDVINEILAKYPKIKFSPSQIPHQQLIREGISVALTVHGTIGCEYPLFGIPVINAGYNPHIAYNFNYNPKTVEEYETLLMNLSEIKKEINKEEIYEFYYTNYKYGEMNCESSPKTTLLPNDAVSGYGSDRSDSLVERIKKEDLDRMLLNNLFFLDNNFYDMFIRNFSAEQHEYLIKSFEKNIESL